MKPSDWTLEMFNQCVAEVIAERKRRRDREYSRVHYLEHRSEILAKRRKKFEDPVLREKRRQYLREYRLKKERNGK